jgi:hypothetical protein
MRTAVTTPGWIDDDDCAAAPAASVKTNPQIAVKTKV